MHRIILVTLLAAFIFGTALPARAEVAEATGIFLLIAPGARSGGMGEAFVALADDGTATWWNPAGLAYLNNRELTLMHVNWLPTFHLPDLYYDFVSYTQNIRKGESFGFNVVYLSLGQTEARDELNQAQGMFRTYETALNASYGTFVSDTTTSLGLNVKFIYSHLSDRGTGQEKGTGVATDFAVDLGYLHKTRDPILDQPLNIGANISNFGPAMAYIDRAQADPTPTNLKVGIAWQMVSDDYNKLTLVYDVNKLLVRKHNDGSTDPAWKALVTSWIYKDDNAYTAKEFAYDLIHNVGVEYWYSTLVALRAGYWNDENGKVKPLTYGATFAISSYRFDFSYIQAGKGHPLTDTMRLSLSIGF